MGQVTGAASSSGIGELVWKPMAVQVPVNPIKMSYHATPYILACPTMPEAVHVFDLMNWIHGARWMLISAK